MAVLAAAVAASACATGPQSAPEIRHLGNAPSAAAPPPFEAEPTRHETFSGTRPFAAGARLRFVSFSVSAQERLLLQRCGDQCSTAKLVRSWSKVDFDKSPVQELVLDEAGDYYLWLRKELPNGEVGPVQAVVATFERENGILRFASGTAVFVAIDGTGMPVDRPDDPMRIGTAPVQDEKSEVRKLEWAGILEKARHGVRQDLIVQIDPGEAENSLLREAAPAPGEEMPRDQVAVSRRVEALARYRAGLRDAKLKLLAPLRAFGVEMTQDFGASAVLVVSISTEEGLRALQASAQVTVISENHSMVPSQSDLARSEC